MVCESLPSIAVAQRLGHIFADKIRFSVDFQSPDRTELRIDKNLNIVHLLTLNYLYFTMSIYL